MYREKSGNSRFYNSRCKTLKGNMKINTVVTQADGNFWVNGQSGVPNDMNNPIRQDIQNWLDAGNTPDPYVAPVPTYQELRAKAYPPIGDQLDALWKGGQPEADMKLIIDGVKATHPKV